MQDSQMTETDQYTETIYSQSERSEQLSSEGSLEDFIEDDTTEESSFDEKEALLEEIENNLQHLRELLQHQ